MRDLRGATAIVTGASRGLGPTIARFLATEQMKLVLAARSATDLERVATELRRSCAGRIIVVPTDVTNHAQLQVLVAAAQEEFGSIDLLVNNAGAVTLDAYHRLTWEQVEDVLQVDLVAPMLLTKLVLPGMLTRRRGHIVNIGSLVGKVGLGNQEAYSSSKAGMIAFTQALRASYRGSGVSASAISPGFVTSEGMFRRFQETSQFGAPPLFGVSSPEDVARAVVWAVKHDAQEVLVSPRPIRLMLAFQALFPGLSERLLSRVGGDIFVRAAEASRKNDRSDATRKPDE
jgi:short-subunit dehydrogenase